MITVSIGTVALAVTSTIDRGLVPLTPCILALVAVGQGRALIESVLSRAYVAVTHNAVRLADTTGGAAGKRIPLAAGEFALFTIAAGGTIADDEHCCVLLALAAR